MSNLTFREFESRAALVEALTLDCQQALQAGVDAKGRASFLVSGGSSPAPAYENLSNTDLPWDKIDVALVDERWVDLDHAGSNEAFVNRTLLQNKAANANLIGMKNSANSAIEGLAECEHNFSKLTQPFDVTILGMGPDGHTASFFPHSQGLDTALNLDGDALCAAIIADKSEVTGDNVERMTLSLAGLLKSRELKLLISGAEKLAVFREAEVSHVAGGTGSDVDSHVASMPVRAVIQQQQVPVTVYWAP